jgi:hypothetical protein
MNAKAQATLIQELPSLYSSIFVLHLRRSIATSGHVEGACGGHDTRKARCGSLVGLECGYWLCRACKTQPDKKSTGS